MHALKSVAFSYDPREDRILAAINAGGADAWSCWLTRRMVLALLERVPPAIARTSGATRKAPAEFRGELIAFERDAALAKTAKSLTRTETAVVAKTAASAELADRLGISRQGRGFRLDFCGAQGGGAAGLIQRAELQRILQMLEEEAVKANWHSAGIKPPPTPQGSEESRAKPVRH